KPKADYDSSHITGIQRVKFDSKSSNSATANPTLTWQHTVGNGNSPVLLVGVSFANGNNFSVSSVTADNQALTHLKDETSTGLGNPRSELWYLQNPTPGTHTITVTMSGS